MSSWNTKKKVEAKIVKNQNENGSLGWKLRTKRTIHNAQSERIHRHI